MYIVMHTPTAQENTQTVLLSTTVQHGIGSLGFCYHARAHTHTRSSGENPGMRGGCPLPSALLTYSNYTTWFPLSHKKNEKKTWIGVDEGRRHPSAGSRRIAERGKDRKLEREAERERKTFLPIWSRHSFSHSSAIDPSSDPVQPTSSTAR